MQFRNDEGTGQFIAAGLAVRAPLHLVEPIFTDDFQFLSEQVRTAVPKMTLPSPSMVLLRSGTAAVDRDVYPELEQFWADLAAAYADEIRELAAVGCRYLQLDDTSLACLNDPSQRAALADRGDDAEHTHERNIRTINAAIADRPEGMRIAAHMCRGNFRSSWIAEGGYDYVAEELFGELDVDAFFCEFDDDRSGGFAPLRFVPPGKAVVLGLVTTKRGRLETPTRSSAASTRPRSTSRSTSSPSPRSAASPPPSRATSSTRTRRLTSFGWWSTSPGTYGATPDGAHMSRRRVVPGRYGHRGTPSRACRTAASPGTARSAGVRCGRRRTGTCRTGRG